MCIVSIHQPNFFPYYPFFQKMEQSDVFVIMRHCQFEKNNYQNRFNIGANWHTMSVSRGMESISKKKYVCPIPDWKRIKNTLPQYSDILDEFDGLITYSLSFTNGNIISRIASQLKIETKIAEDEPTQKTGTDRLVEICQKHNATKYLSGISGKNYLDLSKFKEAGIEVIFQDESKMIKKPILEVLHDRLCK